MHLSQHFFKLLFSIIIFARIKKLETILIQMYFIESQSASVKVTCLLTKMRRKKDQILLYLNK